MVYEFDAFLDGEARVWVAHSDAAAITTEADTKADLLEKLKTIIPDVLHARAEHGEVIPLEITVRVNWQLRATVDQTEMAVA